jgi:hypothetical protein
MRGSHRNIALLLVLAATLVAGSAEARVGAGGGGGAGGAAANAKMSRGAQVRLNRMKQKMSLRPRGAMMQKTRRMLRLGKKRMVRAMNRRQNGVSKVQLMRASSRREVGLGGSEAERTRSRFARQATGEPSHHAGNATSHAAGFPTDDVTPDRLEEASGAKQGKKMRDRARQRAISEHKKRR